MSLSTVEDLITQFDNVSHLISHTDKCYVELVDKFSGSASLRRDYAEFCDIVLNDFDKAEMHRHGADLLESGDDIQDAGDESRSRSSSNVSIRSAQRNFIQSWSSSVMGSEVKSLLRLRSLVLGLGFLLFVFSLLGFLIMEVYLYQNVTQIRLDMLQRTKGYRQNLVKSCITLRSLQMEINGTGRASEKIVSQARSSLQSISQSLTSVHTLNYVDAPTETLLRFFVNKNRIKKVPMPGIARVGSFVEQNVSFWDLGINFIDSVALASLIMLSDLGDPDFSVNILSINKRAVVFIFDNIWTLFSTFDVFFDLVLEEIKFVEVIAHTCAACLVTVNIVLIVAIAFFVLQSSRVVFPKCQHGAVGCGLIRALSHTLLRKVYRYYLASEKRRALIEDEDAARQNVIGEDMIEGQENVEDEHYVLPHESLSPEQHLHLNNQAALILHESATEVCKDRRKRKGSISFADTVGEILRLKMQPEVTADHHLISPFHNLQSEAISPLQIACEDICSMEVGGVDEVKDFNVLYPGKNPAILGVCDCSAINANVGHLTAENVRRYLTDRLISNPEPSKATEYASSAVGEIDSTPTPLASHTSQYSFGTCTHQQGPEKVSMSRSSELNQNTGSQEIGQFCFLDQRFQSKQSKVDNKSDSAKDSSAEKIAESNQLASAQNEATEGGTLCLTLVHCQENTLHGRSAWDAAVAWRILYRRLVYRYTDSDSEGLLHYFDHNESCNDELSHNLVLEGEIKDDDRLCHRHVCSVPEKNGLLASIESKRGSENTGDDDIFVNIPLSDLSEAGSPPGKTKRTGPFLHQHPAAQASSSKGPNNHGQSRQLGDSSRSLTAYAVEAISMAASSGLRRMHSILKSSVADVHHPILKHKPSPINASAEATIQYEPTMQEDEVEDEITVYVVQATVSRMKWYFRSEFHGTALLLVLIVCLCAWLLPLRILPDLVNIAVLSRQARDAGGGVLQCVFFARELVLHDGFSRLSPQQLAQKLRGSCTDLQRSVKRLRLGGDGVVHFGADTLVSPTMDKYQAVMYQPGCPWRVNSSDCSLVSRPQASSQGLYKLLVAFVQSVEVILTKFNATSEATEPSYDHVITNSTLKKVLYEDPDIKFLLENASQDSTDGLALVSKILMEEQARLFSELHQENQTIFLIFLLSVIVVFYFVLIRTTMAAAIHEVERTRAFVNRIPVHIIAREEVLDIRNYFDKDWMHEHEEDNNTGMNTLSRAGSFLDYKE
uniref:Uncharacterized protein n=1 Tax=Cryptomonas curvata TaxID=233186 RepID=A0A7S0MNW7_9CRYP